MQSLHIPAPTKVNILLFFLPLFFLCPFVQAAYPSYPGLYLDRHSISAGSGSVSITWRQALPSIYQWGLSVNAFDISNTYQFSFMSDLVSINQTGAQLLLVDFGAGVTWIQFYVIVLTEDNPESQLIKFQFSWDPAGSSTSCMTRSVTSSKFTFGGASPIVKVYIGWILLFTVTISNYHVWYSFSTSGNSISISPCTSVPSYVNHFYFTILILDIQTLQPQIATYSAVLTASTPANVPLTTFGHAFSDFKCICGVASIQYNVNSVISFRQLLSTTSDINGIQVTANTYSFGYVIDCFAQCPLGTALSSGSLNNCVACATFNPYCDTCSSLSVCSTCYLYAFLQINSTCQLCNITILYCQSCENSHSCTICQVGFFLSTDNTSCLFCHDYMPNCMSCPSMSICLACSTTEFYVSSNRSECLLCNNSIQSCVACLNSSYCLNCQNTTLFLQGNRSQCLLCKNYIEGCFACTSAIRCLQCMNQTTYLSSNSSQCLPCQTSLPYCIECLSASVCLTCQEQTVLTIGNQCKFCYELFPYCLECHSASFCDTCQDQAFLSPNRKQCYLCRNYMQFCLECQSSMACSSCILGWIAVGGCTTTVGCSEVQQISNSNTVVTACIQCESSEFILDSYTRKCLCKQGKLVGSHCTSVIGCISTQKTAGVVYCTYCSVQQHFLFDNTTNSCYCSPGYELGDQTCIQICGDGMVLDAQCDDGNRINGDGCSSNCTVQVGYRCVTSVNFTSSICRYANYNLNGRILSTKRVGIENQAIFVFAFDPVQPYLSSFDLNSYFSLSVAQGSLGSVDWKYQNSEVTATVPFSSSLEGKTAVANFTFDRFYIPHDPIVLSFEIKSDGLQLIYYSNIRQLQLLNSIFVGISMACLVILGIGSWGHKMVGVQLIHTVQIIYYIHFAFADYTLPISSVQMLSLNAINNLYWQQRSQNFVMFADYQKIQFSSEYSQYTLLILTIPAFLLIVCLVADCLAPSFNCSQQAGQLLLNTRTKLYNCLIFPATLGFIFTFFLVSATLSTRSTVSTSILSSAGVSLLMLLISLSLAIVLTNQFKFLLVPIRSNIDQLLRFKLARKSYVPIYQLYILGMTGLLWLVIRTGMTLCFFLMAGLLILMIRYQIVSRPYFKMFDNLSVCFNYLVAFAFLTFFYLRNKGIISSDEQLDFISCYVIAVLLCISTALSTIRVLRELLCSGPAAPQSEIEQNACLIDRQQTSLKQMIQIMNKANNSQRQSLLSTRVESRIRAYREKKEEDPERVIKIEKMRQHLRENRTNNQGRVVRQEMGDM